MAGRKFRSWEPSLLLGVKRERFLDVSAFVRKFIVQRVQVREVVVHSACRVHDTMATPRRGPDTNCDSRNYSNAGFLRLGLVDFVIALPSLRKGKRDHAAMTKDQQY